MQKIGKGQLIEQLRAKGMSEKDAQAAYAAIFDTISGALTSGGSVTLPGVGTLSVKATAARTGVNPSNGQKINIPAGKKVSFKAADSLKKAL